MRHTSKEEYLKFLDESTNKDLLNSLTLEHTSIKELKFLDRDSHSTGTVSIPSIVLPTELLNAFEKADKIFAELQN